MCVREWRTYVVFSLITDFYKAYGYRLAIGVL